MKSTFYRIFAMLVLLFIFGENASAQGFWPKQSTVKIDSIYSNVLKAYRAYSICLPRNYNENSDRKYPVLYLLNGMGADHKSWFENEHAKEVIDLLTASGEASEMIVVSPCAGGDIHSDCWNGYFNMPGWNYEDFFFQEFMPFIEKNYRAQGDKAHRAVAGLSMGGGGTVSYAQRHPDLFCAAYAMSALVDIPGEMGKAVAGANPKVQLLTDAVINLSCIKYVAEADEARCNRLRTVKWFVDCGDDDFLLDRNIEFVQAMHKKNIPLEFRVRDGGHESEYWHSALYMCLPFVSRCFK